MRVWRILEGAKMMASKEKKRQWVEVRVTMMGDSYIIAVALHPPHPDTPNGTTHIKYRMRTHTRWGIWRRERRRPRPTWIVGRRGLRRRRSSLFSRINRKQATDC